MNFFVNIANLVVSIVPFKLRSNNLNTWLATIHFPIQNINEVFSQLVKTHKYDLSFNGQVLYLEHILNDIFDPTARSIYIDDPNNVIDVVFVPYVIENQPSPNTTFLSENESGLFLQYLVESNNAQDFIVYIPQSIFTPEIILKVTNIVKKYKQAGKRFVVQSI